jgi:hypothetical protein
VLYAAPERIKHMKTTIPLVIVALALGFAVGRAHPAHHYEKWYPDSPLLYETSTGKLCDPRLEHPKFPACGNE